VSKGLVRIVIVVIGRYCTGDTNLAAFFMRTMGRRVDVPPVDIVVTVPTRFNEWSYGCVARRKASLSFKWAYVKKTHAKWK
jgi:hypothetical protein